MDARRPAAVVLAGVVGLGLAGASVLLPQAAHLQRPDLVSLAAGLSMVGSGVVLVRARAIGPVGWLVLAAGATWFLPPLAVTGLPVIDVALRCTALLHIGLLVQAIVVVGAPKLSGTLEWLAVAVGYVAALTPVVGGYGLALPVAGVAVVVVVLRDRQHRRPLVRRLRTCAGLLLGVGLIGDAVLRELASTSVRPEVWIAIEHPVEIAIITVLLAVAGTLPAGWDKIAAVEDSGTELMRIVAEELGTPDLRIVLSDGHGGWLLPTGQLIHGPAPSGVVVQDTEGGPCAVLVGSLSAPLSPAVRNVFRLAAANARLRVSIIGQVEELEASRRRLLAAADWERHPWGPGSAAG